MLKKVIRNPYLYVILISYYCVWLVWDAIKLPYHDPAGIISALPEIGYNPANNILRFLIAVLFPPLACFGVWLLVNKRPKKLINFYKKSRVVRITLISAISVMCVLLCIGMGIVAGSTNPANTPTDTYGGPYSHALVDTFHEGETLGPAISYEQPNLAPYRDFVIVHGVFQDVLRTNIAFSLFGESIGASRTFANILTILVIIMYFILLLVLFRGNIYKSALGLCLVAILMLPLSTLPLIGNYIYGINIPFRDIATILFLIAAIIGIRLGGTRKKTLVGISLFVGFLVVAGFANSIDRALFIAALSIVWLIIMLILNKQRGFFKTIALPYIAGALIGIPVVGFAIKWAFSDFFDYLITMSKYKEYLDGIVFSQPNTPVSLILLIVAILITIFGAVLLRVLNQSIKKGLGIKRNVNRVLDALRPIVQRYAIEILLLAVGLFFLRSAIGRALPDHWIYSVQWLYLFLAYIGISYLFKVLKNSRLILSIIAVILLGGYLIFYAINVKRIDLHNDVFPVTVQDKDLMRTDYIETADFLKKNLKSDETFVTLTSEASWYYFVGKPSPIKYPVIWYAFTQSQREIIAKQLSESKNIKYVVTNNNWTSTFDYVPNERRFPEVYKVFTDKYRPYTGFGQQTIWIRK